MYKLTSKKQVDLHGREISRQTLQRYKDFITTYARARAHNQAAIQQLARNYGDTYFFYCLHGSPGPTK
jgi:flagellar biosynthesis chaperone FliJ